MNNTEILEKWEKLSPSEKAAFEELLDSIADKKPELSKEERRKKRMKVFGSLKGKIKMLEGFDDPIDEFFDPILSDDD